MKRLLAVALALSIPVSVAAEDPYLTTPDWESADSRVSTGGALVDLDRDGWLDLVVANGNDILEQPLVVYYNQGDGTFPANPDWLSTDSAYHGHLDVADVNGDGWPDVAVAVLGEFSTIDHAAKLYLNNTGVLSATPDWEAAELANAFGCAFGDVNNDGRPDLAVATGWAYAPPHFFHNYVYLNSGGALSPTAIWSSDDDDHLQGVLWVDANDDGWLDLVGVPAGSETRIYANNGGALETTATWQTTDSAGQDALMATAGDVDGDGERDLLITDNTQLSGTGRFRQYDGIAAGFFETTYDWSFYDGYCSAVALADIDADGHLDLATGAWWDSTRVFLNSGVGLGSSPDWSSAPTSVIEKIIFGDVDNFAVAGWTASFPADGRRLHYLPHQQIRGLISVEVDGVPLAPESFTFDAEHGWIAIGVTAATAVEVEYLRSSSLDMAITNWDSSVGNFLYYNRITVIFSDDFESGDTSAWFSQPE